MKKILIGCIIVTIIGIIYMSYNYKKKKESLIINEIDLREIENGSYTGEYSESSVIVKVKVVVENREITDIETIEYQTDEGKLNDEIIDEVIDKQSTDVDVISSATGSSKFILKAIENALASK